MSRPLYVVTLRPEPGIDCPIVLRRFLKRALRDYGLWCITLEERRPGGVADSAGHDESDTSIR